jgi:hypothetical protein
MSKNALWAMLQGQVTPETAALSKKAAMVTAVTDEKLGKVSVSESAIGYGSLTPDPYGRVNDKRVVVESPSIERFDPLTSPMQQHQSPAPQSRPKEMMVEASPDKIMTLLSGNKTAIKDMKKNLHANPSHQQPVYTNNSPVVDAMNEAMGYTTPQPQMLNEAEIRQTVKQIIKEELDNVLIQNIFSENRMMQLYQEQLSKTLTKILEQRVLKASKGKK